MDEAILQLRCACGWETAGTEDEVVTATREHGRRVHNMEPTRDEVMAMVAATMAPAPPSADVSGRDTS